MTRSPMADWVGRSTTLLEPLVDALADHMMGGNTIHADDTSVPVLAPGTGRTKTGRLWVYVRDERGHGGEAPPAVLFRYPPDGKRSRPLAHLSSFVGHVHTDGYAGFNKVCGNRITEVACMAHIRRKFFDIHAGKGSPIALEALDRIAELLPSRMRSASPSRPTSSGAAGAPDPTSSCCAPGSRRRFSSYRASLTCRSLSAMPSRGGRRSVATSTMGALRLTTTPPNARCAALRSGARAACSLAPQRRRACRRDLQPSLIETAKLNGVDPEAWPRDTITRMADHPARRIDGFLPWNYCKV